MPRLERWMRPPGTSRRRGKKSLLSVRMSGTLSQTAMLRMLTLADPVACTPTWVAVRH